jgi:hypothetical protein
MNDRLTAQHWAEYKQPDSNEAEFEDVDAAVMNSIDDFAPWLSQWMSFVPSKPSIRIRILLVWHSHFLSAACQQTLRRSLEHRSFPLPNLVSCGRATLAARHRQSMYRNDLSAI